MNYFGSVKKSGRLSADIKITLSTNKADNEVLSITMKKDFIEFFKSERLVFANLEGRLFVTGNTESADGYHLNISKSINMYSLVCNPNIVKFAKENGFLGEFNLERYNDGKGFEGFEIKKSLMNFF